MEICKQRVSTLCFSVLLSSVHDVCLWDFDSKSNVSILIHYLMITSTSKFYEKTKTDNVLVSQYFPTL